MTLYFIAPSDDAIGIISPGTKVGWNGQSSPEFDAWRSSNASNIVPVPVPHPEGAAALTSGVVDIYATTSLDVARAMASAMPTGFIYDTGGTIYYADDVPDGTPGPDETPDPDGPPPSPNEAIELIVRADLNIDSPTQLAGAAIAVVIGTQTETAVASFFARIGVDVNFVVFSTSTEAINAYAAGRADALAVADGFGERIAERYLGGAATYDFIDLTLDAMVPGYVKDVALVYEAGLAREADIGGLNYWIDRYEDGMDLLTMASHFLESDEFTDRFGDDDTMLTAQFVDLMYQNVLNRPGEAAGVEYWRGRMNEGETREKVMLDFAASPENVEASTVRLLVETAPGYWTFG